MSTPGHGSTPNTAEAEAALLTGKEHVFLSWQLLISSMVTLNQHLVPGLSLNSAYEANFTRMFPSEQDSVTDSSFNPVTTSPSCICKCNLVLILIQKWVTLRILTSFRNYSKMTTHF